MAQYILINDVELSRRGQVERLPAGKLVDSANQSISSVMQAGGVLWPVGDPIVAAAAAQAAAEQGKRGNAAEGRAIMLAAAIQSLGGLIDTNNLVSATAVSWSLLSTNAATTILTLPGLTIANGELVTASALVEFIASANHSDFAHWNRTITVRNNAGSILNAAGGTTDTDATLPAAPANATTALATATAVLAIAGGTLVVQATRPTGVACLVKATMDYSRGLSLT